MRLHDTWFEASKPCVALHLARPLWQRRAELRARVGRLVLAALVAVAMGISKKNGGIPKLSAVFAVLTGMIGALSGQ